MPLGDPQAPPRFGSPTLWRAIVVVIGLAVAVLSVVVALALLNNRQAIDNTAALSCRLGAFFVGQPVVRAPQQSPQDFRQLVARAQSFLRSLKSEDCSHVKGAAITTGQIRRELRTLHRAAPKATAARRGGSGRQASTAPPKGVVAHSGSSPGQQPGGHAPPPGSSPPPPRPPPVTTTTTTTTPPPTTTRPGPVGHVRNVVCRVNALGIRICRKP